MYQSVNHNRQRGSSLIWSAALMMFVIAPMATLALEVGRYKAVEQQMQDTADAVALAVAHESGGQRGDAIRAGRAIGSQNNLLRRKKTNVRWRDIHHGIWDRENRTFTKTSRNDPRANAVRVQVYKRKGDNGGPMKMFFGAASKDVAVEAIAGFVGAVDSETVVPATSNPWLAGMPGGTYASWMRTGDARTWAEQYQGWTVRRDRADDGSGMANESPVAVQGVPIVPGQKINFDSIGGEMNHSRFTPDASSSFHQPDGQANLTWNMHPSFTPNSVPVHDGYGDNTDAQRYANQRDDKISQTQHATLGEHGKSNILAPHDALVGVFLTDAEPLNGEAIAGRAGANGADGWDVPDGLDFSSPESRDFSELKPKIGQVFFIGDGVDANGQRQDFVIPPGATRLYLGTTDGWEWNNNGGAFQTTITRPAQVYLVR